MSIRFLCLISIFAFFSTVSAGGRGPRGTRGRSVSIHHRLAEEDDSSSNSETSNIMAPRDATDSSDESPSDDSSSDDSKGSDSGGGKKGKKGSKKAPKKRDCKIKQKSTRVEYKCKTNLDDTGGIEDEIGFQVDTSDRLKVNVQYRESIESNSTNTDTNTEYEIAFDRIIEYTKPNRTSHRSEAYNWARDEVVQEMELLDWQSFSAVANNTDGIISTFDVSSVDKTVMFTFKMATSDNGNMTANSMKIDFELMNFPWMKNNSYVALISTITSARTVGVHEQTKNVDVSDVSVDFVDAVNTVGFVPFGAFTWATTADARSINTTDTNTISVIATVAAPSRRRLIENGTVETIAFSFVGDAAKGSSDIYWDPEAGIGYDTSSGSSRLGVYLGSTAGVLAFIALSVVGFVLIRRRRKQTRAVSGTKSPTSSSKTDVHGYPVFS